MEPPRPEDSPSSLVAVASKERQTVRSELAEFLGARPDMADRAEYLFFLTASIVFLLGVLAFLGYIYLDPLRERLYQAVLNKERIRIVMKSAGSWGPLLFIAVQALQVIIMVWPVPLEIAGGFLFGLPLGLLYSTIGLALGSLLAFMMARWLEKRLVVRLVSPQRLKRFRALMKREGSLTAFMIFLIPGIPKDVVCYLLGLTRMHLVFFLTATTLARLPGTLLFSLQGAQVYKGHYGITLGLLAVYLSLAYLLYRHREALYHWMSRWHLEEE
jgi:uncharacterized membrane protein YdjX (TVP38/TMEM64 family)